MPLPSQSARPKGRTTHMYRKSGSRRLPLIVVSVLALLTLGVWWLVRGGDADGASTESGLIASAQSDGQSDGSHNPPPVNASDAALQIADRTPDRSSSSSGSSDSFRMGGTNRTEQGRDRAATSPDAKSTESSARSAPSTDVDSPTERPARSRSDRAQRASSSSSSGASSQPTERESRPSDSAARRRALDRMKSGIEYAAANRPVEARRALTLAYDSGELTRTELREARAKLTEINDRLVFSPEIVNGDPFAFGYTIRSGDSLARLTSRQGARIDWRFVQRINRISRPERIYPGQQIKLITGPFHAKVHKSDYRLDLYLGDGSDRVFVRSFTVGLGEHNSTPVGKFRVRPNSKLINPAWTNPRTREYFSPDDPKNPIGNHWIGMEGLEEHLQDVDGYGIHGTIEPDSIGEQRSMGCIRMHAADVELIYEVLVERESTVTILE